MCLELVLFGSVNYVAVDYKCFVYYIGCMLIAKCRLQSRIYIYVIVIFYYLHKTYILQEKVLLSSLSRLTTHLLLVTVVKSWGILQKVVYDEEIQNTTF